MLNTISFQKMSSKTIKKIYDQIIELSKAVRKESNYESASRLLNSKHPVKGKKSL